MYAHTLIMMLLLPLFFPLFADPVFLTICLLS